jgi:hypothetical protein
MGKWFWTSNKVASKSHKHGSQTVAFQYHCIRVVCAKKCLLARLKKSKKEASKSSAVVSSTDVLRQRLEELDALLSSRCCLPSPLSRAS